MHVFLIYLIEFGILIGSLISTINSPILVVIVGTALLDVFDFSATGQEASNAFNATIIMGGQIKGGPTRLFLIYPEGNFIEATEDTPFFQIGEHKYGKPILDRIIARETSLEDATKAVLVSMDSTLRSNLSVGMPLDLVVIPTDMFDFRVRTRIEADNEEFARISQSWSAALRKGFEDLPNVLG